MKTLAILGLLMSLSGCAGLATGTATSILLGGKPIYHIDGELEGSVRWSIMDRVVVVRGKAKGTVQLVDEVTGMRQAVPIDNPEGVYWLYQAGSAQTAKFNEKLPAWADLALTDEDVAAWGVQFDTP